MKGSWYRGNTHLHTTQSDGGESIETATEMYAQAGYHFLFCTDHWIASTFDSTRNSLPLLLFDGIELDGRDDDGAFYHIVCLGSFRGMHRETDLRKTVEQVRRQDGIVILAHPSWTGNTVAEARKYGFHGVEVYNHICHCLNGKGDGSYVWDAMLESDTNVLGFAADDTHFNPNYPGWAYGWIMVNSEECTHAAILNNIRQGNFYASRGPDFYSITIEGDTVTVHTSSVQYIRLVGPRSEGVKAGSYNQLISRASLQIPETWSYARLEIEDRNGLRAWTNSLFL